MGTSRDVLLGREPDGLLRRAEVVNGTISCEIQEYRPRGNNSGTQTDVRVDAHVLWRNEGGLAGQAEKGSKTRVWIAGTHGFHVDAFLQIEHDACYAFLEIRPARQSQRPPAARTRRAVTTHVCSMSSRLGWAGIPPAAVERIVATGGMVRFAGEKALGKAYFGSKSPRRLRWKPVRPFSNRGRGLRGGLRI